MRKNRRSRELRISAPTARAASVSTYLVGSRVHLLCVTIALFNQSEEMKLFICVNKVRFSNGFDTNALNAAKDNCENTSNPAIH